MGILLYEITFNVIINSLSAYSTTRMQPHISAKAIAENAEIPYVQINTVFLLNKNQGLDAQTINSINKILNTKQNVIVFFEALACTTNGGACAAATEFLLNVFARNPNIIVMGSINEPHRLPS